MLHCIVERKFRWHALAVLGRCRYVADGSPSQQVYGLTMISYVLVGSCCLPHKAQASRLVAHIVFVLIPIGYL